MQNQKHNKFAFALPIPVSGSISSGKRSIYSTFINFVGSADPFSSIKGQDLVKART